jgi:hypothetical protein
MKMSREEMKQEAIKALKKLDVYEPYIKAFKDNDKICMFESYGGFYIEDDSELKAKIKEFEEKTNSLVYAVTHEITSFGELYDLLYVNENKSEWKLPISQNNVSYLFAYVWNKDDDWCSEIGEIGISSWGGGIARRY